MDFFRDLKILNYHPEAIKKSMDFSEWYGWECDFVPTEANNDNFTLFIKEYGLGGIQVSPKADSVYIFLPTFFTDTEYQIFLEYIDFLISDSPDAQIVGHGSVDDFLQAIRFEEIDYESHIEKSFYKLWTELQVDGSIETFYCYQSNVYVNRYFLKRTEQTAENKNQRLEECDLFIIALQEVTETIGSVTKHYYKPEKLSKTYNLPTEISNEDRVFIWENGVTEYLPNSRFLGFKTSEKDLIICDTRSINLHEIVPESWRKIDALQYYTPKLSDRHFLEFSLSIDHANRVEKTKTELNKKIDEPIISGYTAFVTHQLKNVLKPLIDEQNKPFCYGLVGNIIGKHYKTVDGERKIFYGSKHFSSGTKVLLFPEYSGMGHENISVLGLSRKSKRKIKVTLNSWYIVNVRVKSIYNDREMSMIQESSFYQSSRMEKEYLQKFADGHNKITQNRTVL